MGLLGTTKLLAEQLTWCQRAIVACEQMEVAEPLQQESQIKKATFYLAMSWVLMNQGALQRATDNAVQAIDILTPLDYRVGLATAYRHLGVIAIYENYLDKAKELHAQALQYWQELDDEREISSAVHKSWVPSSSKKRTTLKCSVLEKALAIRRRISDRARLSTTLCQLGQLDTLGSRCGILGSHYD